MVMLSSTKKNASERQRIVVDGLVECLRYGWPFEDPREYLDAITSEFPNWKRFAVHSQYRVGDQWHERSLTIGMVRVEAGQIINSN